MDECSEPDCHRTDLSGRGLCSLHYQRYRYRGTLDEIAPPRRGCCTICGEAIIGKDWRAIYCSARCNETARRERRRTSVVRRHEACGHCGGSLSERRMDARFCSEHCAAEAHKATLRSQRRTNRKPCAHCGAPIPLQRQRFCSDDCSLAHRRPEKYGLTRDELQAFLDQHEVCAICGTADWGRKGPQVDHCHASGAVRGVLCVRCNTMLGHTQDDPARLRAAAAYLESR